MRLTTLLAALGLAALLAAGPASAAKGWFTDSYTGLGYVDEDEIDDEAFSSHFSLGYSFGGNWGLEAGYVSFGDFEGSAGGVDASLELDGFSAGVGFLFPMSEDWYMTGHVGAWMWDGETEFDDGVSTLEFDDDGTDLYAGVGFGYRFFEKWSAGLGFTYYDASGDNVDSGLYILGFHTHYTFR